MLKGEGGTCKMNRDEQGGGEVGQKFEASSERTFWMTLKSFNQDLCVNLESNRSPYQLII